MSIRFRYVVALILTGSLITLTFVVLYGMISDQRQDAEIINIAGQQRMLSQRIALLGSSDDICSDPLKQQTLAQSLETFIANHKQLIELNNLPDRVREIYFGEQKLDTKVNKFAETAQRLLVGERCDKLSASAIDNSSTLLFKLDNVVSLFEADATKRVEKMLSIEIYLWLSTLALLCIEAAFIFFPLERKIKDAINKLTILKEKAETSAREAKKASQAKSAFLSSMSHELRTPMNGLFGMIELAIDNPEKSNIYLKKAKTAGRQLLVLINDILDISKIEAGKIKIEHAPVDLLQVLDDVVSLQRVACHRKGLDFHYVKSPNLPHVIKGDITRISQVLHNLLNNAIKFTERGAVTFNVSCREVSKSNLLSFQIEDTGIGIAPSKLDSIFRKFEQADQSTTREYGGTGLGLSIAKKIAQLMCGDITVESKEGVGSTFTFSMEAETSQLPNIKIEQRSTLRCAIIDDLQTSREYFEHIVASLGVYPTSYDSAKAYLTDDPFSFDVIILDLSMPEMSGEDLLEQLRDMNPENFPRVILISAELERLENENDVSTLIWRTHAKPINRRELEHDLGQFLTDKNLNGARELSNKNQQRILLAEDNEINAEIVKTILQNEGYKYLHVKNGKDAIDACKQYGFDLILMDCNMPVMGGIEAARFIRKTLKQSMPIVALTANAFAEDKDECLSAGMSDFLAKPLYKDTLLMCVHKYIGA